MATLAVTLALSHCRPPTGHSGAELYQAQCARCHATNGTGDPKSVGLYPSLDLVHSRLIATGSSVRGIIRQRIAEGYDAMPGFAAKLDDDDLDRLVDYLLQLPEGKGSH